MIFISYRKQSLWERRQLPESKKVRRLTYSYAGLPKDMQQRLHSVRKRHVTALDREFAKTPAGLLLTKPAEESVAFLDEKVRSLSFSGKTVFDADVATRKQAITHVQNLLNAQRAYFEFLTEKVGSGEGKEKKPRNVYRDYLAQQRNCIKDNELLLKQLRDSL